MATAGVPHQTESPRHHRPREIWLNCRPDELDKSDGSTICKSLRFAQPAASGSSGLGRRSEIPAAGTVG